MTMNGAAGQTLNEMRTALQFGGFSVRERLTGTVLFMGKIVRMP